MRPDAAGARPCLIVRVSSDDQDTRQQEYEARQWIREQFGADLPDAAIFREEDVSGRLELEERPGLYAAYQACRAGRFTHLIVRKMDRSARNVAAMARVIRDLKKSGVAFIAIMEAVDTSQFGDEFKAHLFLSFAQHFSDNLGEEVKKGKRKRARLGLTNGWLPFGSIAGTDKVPVPDTSPVVGGDGVVTAYEVLMQIFTQASQGQSIAAITAYLNTQNWHTNSVFGHRPFARSTVRRILHNRFYCGEILADDGTWQPGAHQPLIAPDLWGAAQTALARHSRHPQTVRHDSLPHPFGGGIVRCVACHARGEPANYHAKRAWGEDHYHRLICGNRQTRQRCQEPTIREIVLEQQILAMLRDLIIPEELHPAIVALYASSQATAAPAMDTAAQRKRILDRIEREKDLYRMDIIGATEVRQRVQALQRELTDLDAQAAPAPISAGAILTTATTYLRGIVQAWGDANDRQRRDLVQNLFEAIWVQAGRVVAIEPAPHIKAYFAFTHHADMDRQSCSVDHDDVLATLPTGAVLVPSPARARRSIHPRFTDDEKRAIGAKRLAGARVTDLCQEYHTAPEIIRKHTRWYQAQLTQGGHGDVSERQ